MGTYVCVCVYMYELQHVAVSVLGMPISTMDGWIDRKIDRQRDRWTDGKKQMDSLVD